MHERTLAAQMAYARTSELQKRLWIEEEEALKHPRDESGKWTKVAVKTGHPRRSNNRDFQRRRKAIGTGS